MHPKIVLGLAMASVLAVAVPAQVPPSGEGVQGNAPIAKPAADLNWIDLDPVGAPEDRWQLVVDRLESRAPDPALDPR